MLSYLIDTQDPVVKETARNLARFISDTDGFSYSVASFIMNIVDWILGVFGLEHNTSLVTFLYMPP